MSTMECLSGFMKVLCTLHECDTLALSAETLYKWDSTSLQYKNIMFEVPLGLAFVQFCVIAVTSLIMSCFKTGWTCQQKRTSDIIHETENVYNDITHERVKDPELRFIFQTKKHCVLK